ncbi:MAG: 50S ribosomal protein L19 [Ignavibacteria bacterium]|nr:50S ribosomal protein L19 [Ignavibacteria bacterium]MBT8382585.1 50S ribosomal protein L19 [Ignavibacteria bacterium]MBT8391156.1 50S ribosomal protein L19 [Ignavibacteria bacterium]NNJ54279.1 50S ribosomal protein L19 [Ignavibacteriaceae bacterium]NNL20244.1 50S ribosomal protein L19 [Ignavibacteriaceae bacterium]
MEKINNLLQDEKAPKLPNFKTGDRIKVFVSIIEGDKERVQPFEGDVISIRGSGASRTFTVRKLSSGVGVERIFHFKSPKISKVDVIKEGNVRRAKLYYLRNLSGKAARIKNK